MINYYFFPFIKGCYTGQGTLSKWKPPSDPLTLWTPVTGCLTTRVDFWAKLTFTFGRFRNLTPMKRPRLLPQVSPRSPVLMRWRQGIPGHTMVGFLPLLGTHLKDFLTSVQPKPMGGSRARIRDERKLTLSYHEIWWIMPIILIIRIKLFKIYIFWFLFLSKISHISFFSKIYFTHYIYYILNCFIR